MHRLLLFCLCCVLGFSLQAEELYLGYCEGKITSETNAISGSNKTIQCAICLPASNVAGLKGQHITRVNVGVNPDCPKLPSYVVAWVRSSQNGSNLAEKKVAVSKGWNDIAFDAPVEIPEGSDLWVGFSYPQSSTKLKVVAFGGDTEAGCSYWYNNGSMAGWTDHSTDAPGALCVEAIVEGDNLPQHDLAILNCGVARKTVKLGMPIVVNGQFRNNALATAEGFEIAYSVNDGQLTGVVPFAASVAYRDVQSFTFEIPSEGLADGNADISFELRWLGGMVDEYTPDNSAKLSVTIFSEGFERNVLLEEFTTEQCGWCPLGISYINKALDDTGLRGSVVWVCHHAGFGTDFLTANASQTYTALYGPSGTFAPAMMVDRTQNSTYCSQGVVGGATMDPVYTADWLSIDAYEPAFATVEIVSAICIDNEIKIRIRAEKYDAFDAQCKKPRINVWVTENHIPMRSQADNSGLKTGYHEHALRTVLTATWGDAITWDGNAYEAEFTCQKNSGWEAENLQAVAFISNYGATSIYQRQVYNAAEQHLSDTEQGISQVTTDAPSAETVYTVDGRLVSDSNRGIALRRIVAADGVVRTEKVIRY